ncbi:enoyl-CoA hydratase/isomerase family protein [Parasphingorhabdus pacifica]
MTSEILLEERGALGRITLNRPKAINSLTLGMVREMSAALEQWRADDRIQVVLIDGAGERGLCAGGDVRAIYDAAKAGDETVPETFWSEEYRLNAVLPHYPKPIVSIMDGICMGGGVGIAAHDSHRVVTERSKIGMPEVGIGFVPDVGGTFLLSRTPGELGTHAALTGAPISGADAIECGLADHYVPSDKLEAMVDRLATADVDAVLREFSERPPAANLAGHREWIDAAYSANTVEDILERLRARPEQEARDAAEMISTKSPLSLKLTLCSLRSRPETLEAALDQEYRVSLACVRIGDFVEGVRATLVDKDRDPKWQAERLEDVEPELIDKFFAPLGAGELGLSR